MALRVSTVALVVLLAGCAGPSDDGGEGGDVTVITDPTDFSYLENNTTDREHVHNYWGSNDRLRIADETFRCASSLITDPVICDHQPADPIPLGTGIIEVTFDWTEDPQADDVTYYVETELWVKTAADQQASPVGVIEAGERVTFDVTNEQNDLPHQRMSAWEFALYVWGDRDAPFPLTYKRFAADVHITIEAVRTLEIPPFPGHPDLWQNRTEYALVTDYRYPDSGGDEIYVQRSGTVVDDRRIRPDPGAIVPRDASHITVTLTQDVQAVSDEVDLLYHGAGDREWIPLEPDEENGATRIYHIPVDGDGDSPYALQSLWEFWTVYGDGPILVGDTFWGSYTVSVTIYREVT